MVRHGEAAARWGVSADPGLSEAGLREAEQAALEIRPTLAPDTLLISSPLRRAWQTAQPLAHLLQADILEDSVFREIPAPVPLQQRQGWLQQFMRQQWIEQADDLKLWRATIMRRLLAMEQPAVVFTHFLVINAVVGQVLGRDETLCCFPANGSITRFRHCGDGLELLALGRQMQSVVN
ncbi:MAG: histidine phosphatase family protein [Halioglobus sp.]